MSNYESKLPGVLVSRKHDPDSTTSINTTCNSSEPEVPSDSSELHDNNKAESSEKDKKFNKSIDKEFFQMIWNDCPEYNITIDKCVRDSKYIFQHIWLIESYRLSLKIKTKENLFSKDINVTVKRFQSKEYQELYKAQNDYFAYKIYNTLNIYAYGEFPAPFCYLADKEMIIITDLPKEGYKCFVNNENYITVDQCKHILKALARFHAATFVLKFIQLDYLDNIEIPKNHDLFSGKNSFVLRQQQKSLQNMISIYKGRNRTQENLLKIEALENLLKYSQTDIENLLQSPKDNYVFCHGNLLPQNCLFKQEKNKVDVKFINFQKFSYFSLASDLVNLFFVNLLPDEYRKYKSDLLKYYYCHLIKYIKIGNVPVDKKLTPKWLRQEINQFTEYGIINALGSLPMIYCSNLKNNRNAIIEKLYEERMDKWVEYYAKKLYIMQKK